MSSEIFNFKMLTSWHVCRISVRQLVHFDGRKSRMLSALIVHDAQKNVPHTNVSMDAEPQSSYKPESMELCNGFRAIQFAGGET